MFKNLAAAAAAKAASVGSQVASAAGDLLEAADEKAGAVISEQLAQTPSTATRKSASAVFDDEAEEISALRQQLEEAQEGQRRATLAADELVQAEAALAAELAASKAEAVQLQERERAVKAKVVEKLRTQGDELSKRDELIRSLRARSLQLELEGARSSSQAESERSAALAAELSSALAAAKLRVESLGEAQAAAAQRTQHDMTGADEQLRSLRYGMAKEGRESAAAAALCRQGVKELVGLHQALGATLQGMEEQTLLTP